MNRIQLKIITSCVLSVGCASVNLLQAQNRPNIIVILSDDQGWGDLSINGNKNLRTPNIDKLAHQGVRFTQFYVSPVCSPTRAELLTGSYHYRCGVYSTSDGGERWGDYFNPQLLEHNGEIVQGNGFITDSKYDIYVSASRK